MARVERDAEMAVLRTSLSACAAGAGGAVVVRGPVGVGKTELLRGLAREATADGVTYIGAVGSQAERVIPMGAMAQLFARLELPDDVAERAQRLLEAGALTSMLHDREDDSIAQVVAPVLDGLTGILLSVAHRAPLLIGVDDAHVIDVASLQCLRYLVRRIERARVLVVLNDTTTVRATRPTSWAELLSQPHCQLIRLNMLSPMGVAAVLRTEPVDLDDNTPSMLYEATGGSPLLLMALIDEMRAGTGGRRTGLVDNPVLGHAFGQAVLNCLYRSDPSLLPLLRAVAVLDEPVPVTFLAELLDSTTSATAWALNTATEAGLMHDGRMRHCRSREVVLDLMGPDDRSALHATVAEMLYQAGAAPLRIARHSVAAQHIAPWTGPVLVRAAEQALAEDDTGLALDCLRLADHDGVEPAERVGIESLLLRAKWRLDPVVAERHLNTLRCAARAGQLAGTEALALVAPLQWCGRPAEAMEVLDRVADAVAAGRRELAAPLHSARVGLAYWYPGVAGPVPGAPLGSPAATADLQNQATGIISTVLTAGYTDAAVADALALLRRCRLDDTACHPVMAALETLIFAEDLDAAAYWCDHLLDEAQRRSAPAWTAMLSGLRAMVSYRRGELTEAERHARTAFFQIPPKGLGVLIGIPLSVLILTTTRVGEKERALSHLSVAVPDAMFQTPIGLHYRRARGRYHLACHNYDAAIQDFEACGDLMRRWGIDLPGIVPWRTDLAEARLASGASAGNLANEQLDRLGTRNCRTRGISLRVLAASSPLQHRPAILREAAELLQSCGDQMELADALAELSNAQHALGEYTDARVTGRRAQQLASQYLMTGPGHARPPAEAVPEITLPADDPTIFDLSDAERRVASLAAQGCTNRQIARKLFVTVSTVEQHLTRVYRKLQINRRSDLPPSLLSRVGNPA